MNKPNVTCHTATQIWSAVEYNTKCFKKGQEFVTVEDYLAALDLIEQLLDERDKANG